ncbi:MAG: 5'-Nucleotidase domain protein [Bacteroidetes bacterium]|nr:5'-Nucleotidase domain protein [Bacteroidota bacterium]
MKRIVIFAQLLWVVILINPPSKAQFQETTPHFTYTNHDPNATGIGDSSLYKRKADWQQIVDRFWGPGLALSQKQQVFNTFASYIHDRFPGFSGLNIRWDSLRAFYAQQLNDSTSRGGFSAILSKLAGDLRDYHVMGWDTIMQSTPLSPGTPIFAVGLESSAAPGGMNYGDVRHFGAVLTPQPDSSLLVLRAAANHPLGLQPGDIILGYEGVPWKRLVFELLQSPLPRRGVLASTESSRMHMLLTAAGLNWHLFDTIDIVRYPSGALEHLPTSLLSSLDLMEYVANAEQLPVASVPQPDYEPVPGANPVSYGIVGGTNIGYIYVTGHPPGTKDAFRNAVSKLMETDGLIIDIRFSAGGFVSQGPEAGLALLMNYSTQTLIGLERSSLADLYALKPLDPSWLQAFSFEADPNTLYDRPIAVLIGPFAVSQGDFTAYKLRYLSGARFFGKSVNGAVTGMTDPEPVVGGFFFVVPFFVLADHREPNVLLIRREFPDFEPVWFDKDDVARGDDTVVKRAVAWITSVAHAHGVVASQRYFRPGLDTARLTAVVENPQGHPISVIARFVADTSAVDSTRFADDGQHGDGAARDGLWGTSWIVPGGERFYNVTTRVVDPEDSATFPMPFTARFTTAGPVACVGDSAYTDPVWGQTVSFRLKFSNLGSSLSIPTATATIHALDTASTILSGNPVSIGDIAPGQIRLSSVMRIAFSGSSHGSRTLAYALGVCSGGVEYWHDTLTIQVSDATGVAALDEILDAYALRQNYPNPLNPTTLIGFQLPVASGVRLALYDLLGREVAVLVNEQKPAGSYEVQFDAAGLPSGVYLYRLTAGSFVQTRKMIVVK